VKICRTCKAEKPLRQFYRAGGKRRRTECKDCTLAAVREAYQVKRESRLAYRQRYRASERGRAVIIAYRRSPRGLAKQAEANRFRRAMRRIDTQRVSRGTDRPWQSHTERKVCRPEALSVASSTRTREITGVAGSAETRYHERRADLRGVAGNASAAGRGPHFGARS
jgi:hypothetical protein